MKPSVIIEVVRGSPGFNVACYLAVTGLAMVAASNAMAPEAHAAKLKRSDMQADPFARVAPKHTAASAKLQKLIPNQDAEAEPLSLEQAQILKYGVYPPVKTALQINGKLQTFWTLHPFDLVRLAREGADRAALIDGVRVSPERVGAIMMTESSLVARTGFSSNGKTGSYGLGQLEMNTAKALGVKDLNDPVESATAVARLLGQGERLAKTYRHVDERLVVSLAYNTSSSLRYSLLRQYGASLTFNHLPLPTQHHVKNMAYGQQLMANFSRLADQHEKLAAANILSTQVNPKEISVNTSHSPAPSTRTLFAGLATDAANQIRMTHNQKTLEKAGQLVPIPMTSKGLETMRGAVAAYVQRAGDSKSVSTQPVSPTSLMSSASADVAKIAVALTSKVAANLASIRDQLTGAKPDAVDRGITATSMGKAKDAGFTYFGMAKMTIQAARELQEMRQRDIQKPA